jgi:sugar lactone lactonase YvrE
MNLRKTLTTLALTGSLVISLGASAADTRLTFQRVAGSDGGPGFADGAGSAARFNHPAGVAVDGSGNVYVADLSNQLIRKITPSGVVTTLAGVAGSSGFEDGAGGAARFQTPSSVAVDSRGNVFVADRNNCVIRKITPGGTVSTLAGRAGEQGSADGPGDVARFSFPYGVAVDTGGNVYVADSNNNTIRKITTSGIVSTLAGTVLLNGSADGSGSAAQFSHP